MKLFKKTRAKEDVKYQHLEDKMDTILTQLKLYFDERGKITINKSTNKDASTTLAGFFSEFDLSVLSAYGGLSPEKRKEYVGFSDLATKLYAGINQYHWLKKGWPDEDQEKNER